MIHTKILKIMSEETGIGSGELKPTGIRKIKELLANDHAVQMVPESEYDCIAIMHSPITIGRQFIATVFNDRREGRELGPFADGGVITGGTIKEVCSPIDGLKLVKTKRTTYLVV